jgi:glycosyltransferase involved in cell wall biosynthesis
MTRSVLMLNYEYPPLGGGAGNATYYLLKEFSKFDDLKVDLVVSSTDKFSIAKPYPNITIHFLNIGKNGNIHYQSNRDLLVYSLKAWKYSQALLKTNKYDLCHAFFGIPCGYLAMKLKQKYGLPYVVSLRGSDVPFYNKRFYWFDRLVFKKLSKKIWQNAKATITNSLGLKNLALESAPEQKIGIIYNGVEINEFKPFTGKSNNKKLTLVSTGRLIERKGYQYLIPALDDLDVTLWLIGDGNFVSELKKIASDKDVVFLGKKSHAEIIAYLQKADVFVLPSLNEGMSNSILEAMACGLPIITTDTGGSDELIRGNGFVVAKQNSEALNKTISKYLNDHELLLSHGNSSRQITKNMIWKNMADNYWKEYRI